MIIKGINYEIWETITMEEWDLLTEKSLTNPYLIKSINQGKQLIYDRRNQKISA